MSALDLVQLAVLDLPPGRVAGALAGALLYALLAYGDARGLRPALIVTVGMPLVPASVLALTALGVDVGVRPDAVMMGIAVVQLAASMCAGAALRR